MPTTAASSKQQFRTYKTRLFAPKADTPGTPRVSRERSSWELIGSFLSMLGRHRWSMLLALSTLTIATLLALVPPLAIKFVVDHVLGERPLPEYVPAGIPSQPWPLLVIIVTTVLVVSFIKVALQVWGRWNATRVTKLLQMSVRKQVFEHALRLPLHRIHEMKSGGAASVLRQDAGSVGELVFALLYNPWRAIIQLVGSLVILAVVDWKLLIGAMLMIPCVYLTHRTWISRIRPQHRSVRKQREQVDGLATESFGGMRVIRGFSRQRAETGRIMQGNHFMARQELYAWWWARFVEIIWETIIPLASAGLLLYGGYQVLNGALTLGDLMMFLAYLLMLLEPLAILAQSSAAFQSSLSGLERVLDLLEEPREMAAQSQRRMLQIDEVAGRVTLENLCFQYPGVDEPALQNICLDVAAGETIALVGPSGAGKTTLCNLVARFYEPTSGRLLLDGRDVDQIEVESYRRLLGLVEQDVFLFDGTVAENIGYSRRDANIDEVMHAARIANAAEFIEKFPQGYETVIGERGVKLSGGQRQRIAIARAVLADPKILILDEATSNLDTESERLIQDSFTTLMQNRTCFVIAHRLSTITQADRIAVLQNGQITELGTHAELISRGGQYCRMVQLQNDNALPAEMTG